MEAYVFYNVKDKCDIFPNQKKTVRKNRKNSSDK